jgi:hypothetical protein
MWWIFIDFAPLDYGTSISLSKHVIIIEMWACFTKTSTTFELYDIPPSH